MKTKHILVGAVVLLTLSACAWAADVAGKWATQAQGAEITLTFKVDGNTLTGTVDNSQAGPADIKEGKINGDEISFAVVRKMGESEIKIMWKGKVAGDEIKFKREVQGGGGMGGPGGGGAAEEIVAKRVK
jgi:autotransporter translocation and assembly factor TamB